ncbi:acetyl-CoA C-acyltransferase [Brevibacterium zhoupengii]|uniref:acetyl-CoA C-acyltransferase n=1 Tax=Brevibacterium zhoupengii TaxID=2898795 RepID=UPI001E3B48CC|nr:acetyl-CoA C-acyltransferase [Brevibacterium zhoupengii]
MSNDPRTPVLVSAARTPVGKFNGALKNIDPLDLGGVAVAAAMDRAGDVIPDHVIMANIIQAGNGQNPARSAGLRGGVPTTVPAITLNNVCLASMFAAGMAATMIRAGEMDSAIVGGFDSMSRAPHALQIRQASPVGTEPAVDLLTKDGLWCAVADSGMGPISDQANADLRISRADQDEFSVETHRRAHAATEAGRLAEEIAPMPELSADEGIRPDSSMERLQRLKPAFTTNGTVTAGNASQMSDAGSAGLMMTEELANSHGLVPMVEIVATSTVAGPDASLHLKPAAAASKLLEKVGMSTSDIGLWEINEAFAGVALAAARDLNLDLDIVNVNGGAIAIGHPLGASGFRITMSLAREMRRRGIDHGIATMCGGGGQGQAILLRLR